MSKATVSRCGSRRRKEDRSRAHLIEAGLVHLILFDHLPTSFGWDRTKKIEDWDARVRRHVRWRDPRTGRLVRWPTTKVVSEVFNGWPAYHATVLAEYTRRHATGSLPEVQAPDAFEWYRATMEAQGHLHPVANPALDLDFVLSVAAGDLEWWT